MKVQILIPITILLLLLAGCSQSGTKAVLEEENAVLKGEVIQAKDDLNNTAGELLDLKAEMKVKETELQKLRTEIDKLQTDLESIREDKEFYQKMVETLKSEKAQTPSVPAPVTRENAPTTASSTMFDYKTEYDEALQLFYGGRYTASIQKFEQLLVHQKNNTLADNCQYWIGENLYSMNNCSAAITAFEKVQQLGDANKAEAAQFKIVLSYVKLGDRLKADEALRSLEQNYPGSEYIDKAQRYLE